MTDQLSRAAGRRSAQVSDDQEHEDAGEQHSPDHDELVLGGSPLDQPHHCVGQPQHVGHIQHLLVRPLKWSPRPLVDREAETLTASQGKTVWGKISQPQLSPSTI